MTAVSDALAALIEEGRDLSEAEAATVLDEIMSGASIPPTQIAALLTALRAKGETIDEIVGFARVMREKSLRIVVPGVQRIVDVVGTGGDAPDTFNVSTAGAFVVAGCGVTVGQARQPRHVVALRQRRRAGGARRGDRPAAPRDGRLHPRDRRGLPLRAVLPPGHAFRRARAARVGLPHRLQHPRPADQPGRHDADGRRRRHAADRRAVRAGAGPPGQPPRAGRARTGGHRRGFARRPDDGLGVARRAASSSTRSRRPTSTSGPCRWPPWPAATRPATPPPCARCWAARAAP